MNIQSQIIEQELVAVLERETRQLIGCTLTLESAQAIQKAAEELVLVVARCVKPGRYIP